MTTRAAAKIPSTYTYPYSWSQSSRMASLHGSSAVTGVFSNAGTRTAGKKTAHSLDCGARFLVAGSLQLKAGQIGEVQHLRVDRISHDMVSAELD